MADDSDVHDINFFVDRRVILNLTGKSILEAEGHVHLLSHSGSDSLKVATLLEGTSVDFLFGVERGQNNPSLRKVNKVKSFIQALDESDQEAVADFYYLVYRAIAKYHRQIDHPCAWFFWGTYESDLDSDIQDAYNHLSGMLGEIETHQPH